MLRLNFAVEIKLAWNEFRVVSNSKIGDCIYAFSYPPEVFLKPLVEVRHTLTNPFSVHPAWVHAVEKHVVLGELPCEVFGHRNHLSLVNGVLFCAVEGLFFHEVVALDVEFLGQHASRTHVNHFGAGLGTLEHWQQFLSQQVDSQGVGSEVLLDVFCCGLFGVEHDSCVVNQDVELLICCGKILRKAFDILHHTHVAAVDADFLALGLSSYLFSHFFGLFKIPGQDMYLSTSFSKVHSHSQSDACSGSSDHDNLPIQTVFERHERMFPFSIVPDSSKDKLGLADEFHVCLEFYQQAFFLAIDFNFFVFNTTNKTFWIDRYLIEPEQKFLGKLLRNFLVIKNFTVNYFCFF